MKNYIYVSLDSKNGRSEFVPRLNVKRNSTYVLILRPDATEAGRLQDPQTLEPILKLMERHLGDIKK
jgi:hypothetical protein